MLKISDKASEELTKVLESEQAQGKHLVLFFRGVG
jgi:hypothetical protein